jgi:HEAT repeat protein
LCIDENPDVRARSAPVIAYLDDTRATGALLALLEDSEWFVRMHAARALARNKFMSSAPKIAQRLTDSQWMVREATTRTLLSFGQEGLDCLIDHALNTRDRYSKEQIADEFQRAGVIPTLLAQYARTQNAREIHVLRQFADLGKTSCMLAAMEESSDRFLRRKFLADFGRHPDPQIRGWVKSLDGGAPHLELPRGAAVRAAMRPHEEGA